MSEYNQWVDLVSEWRNTANVIPRLVREDIVKSKLVPDKPGAGPKSLFTDPLSVQYAMGYKDRYYSTSYDVLKRVPQQLALIGAIIQTRCNQVASFAVPYRLSKSLGFAIKHKNPSKMTTKGEREFIQSMEKFIYNCGADNPNPHNPYARDDFETFLKKIVRDSLMYDQAAFEIIPDKRGQPYEFMAVDASTIRFASSDLDLDFATAHRNAVNLQNGYNVNQLMPNNTWAGGSMPFRTLKVRNPELHDIPAFVQLINGQIRNYYTRDELAFGVRNPRTDIYVQGYGYSELEQLITIITAHLYAEEYNRRFFTNGSAPKGIINFKGDNFTPDQLEAFRRQWRANVEGVQNSWRTPIMQAEQGIEWINLHPTNQEMEYSMWIEYLIKITCFTGDTPITMADGSLKEIKDISPGDSVRTHTGGVQPVRNLQVKHYEGPLYHLRAGEVMRVTGEHPLWVASSEMRDGAVQISEPSWKNAADVREGIDYLCIPKKTYTTKANEPQTLYISDILDEGTYRIKGDLIAPKGNAGKYISNKIDVTPDVAFVLGLFVSEGNTTDSAVYFTFSASETGYVDCVRDFAKKIGVHCRQYAAKKSTANVCLHSSILASVFSKLCGSKAVEKRVPDAILASNDDVQRAFLSGVFAGDGSVPEFRTGSATATLTTVSPVAIEQIRAMLLGQDVYSHKYVVTNSGGFESDRIQHRIDINGKYAARLASWLSGPKGDALRERVSNLTHHKSSVYESPTYFYVPVTEVWTEDYKGPVYNIEVAEEHTYQAHRYAVHNCAVFLIDPAELNFDMHGGVQQTPLFESSQEWKLKASRDRGLKPLLRFIAKMINEHIISKIDDHFMFDFLGLDELTEQEKHELRKEQLATYMTLNEIRREEDLPDLPNGDVPLNPTYTMYVQQKKQMELQERQQQAAMVGGDAVPPTEVGEGEAPAEPQEGGEEGSQYADGFTKSIRDVKILEISFNEEDDWMDVYRGVEE